MREPTVRLGPDHEEGTRIHRTVNRTVVDGYGAARSHVLAVSAKFACRALCRPSGVVERLEVEWIDFRGG